MKNKITFIVSSASRQATFYGGENMIGQCDVNEVTAEYLDKIIGDEGKDQSRNIAKKIEIIKKSLALNFPTRSAK